MIIRISGLIILINVIMLAFHYGLENNMLLLIISYVFFLVILFFVDYPVLKDYDESEEILRSRMEQSGMLSMIFIGASIAFIIFGMQDISSWHFLVIGMILNLAGNYYHSRHYEPRFRTLEIEPDNNLKREGKKKRLRKRK